MDYDDDGYDQYQQYEDELYKDASGQSGSENEVDSELEDNMLAHIHYSTNVYKKAGTSSTAKKAEDQASDGSTAGRNPIKTPPNGHLAASPNVAEDYFKAVNQGTELDSDIEEGEINGDIPDAVTHSSTSKVKRKADNLDSEEESRYGIEKKRGLPKNSWSEHAVALQNDSDHSEEVDEQSDSSDEVDELASDDSDEEDEKRENYPLPSMVEQQETELSSHVLELGKPTLATDEENDYDVDTELAHLEDEKFKGRSRYYMDEKDRASLCFRCKRPGHMSKDCNVMICTVCGAENDHTFANCPNTLCFNCRRRGHVAEDCPKPRGYGGYCSNCYSKDHSQEDCPTVWREYLCVSEKALQKIVLYCYNCGELGHFGDSCHRARPLYSDRSGASAFHNESDSGSKATYLLASTQKPFKPAAKGTHTSKSYGSSSSSRPHESSSSPSRYHDSRYDSRHSSDHHHHHHASSSSSSRHHDSRHSDHYRDRDHHESSSSKRDHRHSDYRGSRDSDYDYHRHGLDSERIYDRATEKEENRQRSFNDPDRGKETYSKREVKQHDYLHNHTEVKQQDSSGADEKNSKKKKKKKKKSDRGDDSDRGSKAQSSKKSTSKIVQPVTPMASSTQTSGTVGNRFMGSTSRPSSPSTNGSSKSSAAGARGGGADWATAVVSPRDGRLANNHSRGSGAGSSMHNPVVLTDSPPPQRLHHSLPTNPYHPNGVYNNNYSQGTQRIQQNTGRADNSNINGGVNSSRPSFAEQNAYPRGGNGGYGSGSGPGPVSGQNGLIGVPPRHAGGGGYGQNGTGSAPPGPMYSGGYSRRR